MNLYDTLKDKVQLAARALALPLGWEGEPFVPPHASHLRAQVVFENQKQATLGATGLTQINGRIGVKVVVKVGRPPSPRPASPRPPVTASVPGPWST